MTEPPSTLEKKSSRKPETAFSIFSFETLVNSPDVSTAPERLNTVTVFLQYLLLKLEVPGDIKIL